MMKQIKLVLIATLILCSTRVYAQELTQESKGLENQINIVFGMSQLALNGFNIEGNFAYKRLIFDYSHGVSLNLNNQSLEDGADKTQGLAVHLPWTTGFGVGYRFNDWLNLRVEPKWHKYELYYDTDNQTSENLIGDYTTFTLGLGLYTNLKPFKKQDNFLKGIMIAPNVRWCPKVSSSLDGDSFEYFNKNTDQQETHNAREIGMANTPFFINMSIGYSFSF